MVSPITFRYSLRAGPNLFKSASQGAFFMLNEKGHKGVISKNGMRWSEFAVELAKWSSNEERYSSINSCSVGSPCVALDSSSPLMPV